MAKTMGSKDKGGIIIKPLKNNTKKNVFQYFYHQSMKGLRDLMSTRNTHVRTVYSSDAVEIANCAVTIQMFPDGGFNVTPNSA